MTYDEPRRIRVVDELRYCHRDRYWMDCEGHLWRWDWYEDGHWSYRDDDGWASLQPGYAPDPQYGPFVEIVQPKGLS